MEEASQCNKVGLIFEGEMLAVDTPQKLVSGFTLPLYCLHTPSPTHTFEVMQKTKLASDIQLFGGCLHLTDSGNKGAEALRTELLSCGVVVEKIEPLEPQLEDVFLSLLNSCKVGKAPGY
jgi:ABC-2 type transport system ATP-binding protein